MTFADLCPRAGSVPKTQSHTGDVTPYARC